MEIQFERRCPKCAETKPVTEFPRNASKPTGRADYCKPCTADSKRRAIANSKARFAAQVAKLSPADRERLGLPA